MQAIQIETKPSIDINFVCGAIGMILSPMLFVATLFSPPNPELPGQHPVLAGLSGVLYLAGAMATSTAIRNRRITGDGGGALILYIVQMIGLFLAMWCDILENFAPQLRETTLFFITDMAYPFSHLLMIFVGVAIWRAGVWRGWRLFPAFIIGLTLPSFFFISALVGRENSGFVFLALVTTGFFLLGLAVCWKD